MLQRARAILIRSLEGFATRAPVVEEGLQHGIDGGAEARGVVGEKRGFDVAGALETISMPATGFMVATWGVRVKNTASESVPRTLKTRPTTGRSPYLLCNCLRMNPMAVGGVFAPSTVP